MRVEIPAQRASLGRGIPDVCARHGNPATSHLALRFRSRPHPAALLLPLSGAVPLAAPHDLALLVLCSLGPLSFVIYGRLVRKTITVERWPFCDRCSRAYRWTRGLGWCVGTLAVAGIPGAFVAYSAGASTTFAWMLLFGGVLAIVLAPVVFALARGVGFGWVHVSRDGRSLIVPGAHQGFVDARSARHLGSRR